MTQMLDLDTPSRGETGRVRAAWRAAHVPVAGVSPAVRRVAFAVQFAVLPSCVWRLPIVFDSGLGPFERVYPVLLSVLSEAVAFTAFGLIARWGEVFPRWVPLLAGRRVPPAVAVVPAVVGAVFLTVIWTTAYVTTFLGVTIRGDAQPADFPGAAGGLEEVWFYLCYTPLLLWGPLLGVLAVAYAKRRRVTG
ncbi:hypothetical protein ACFYVL_01815 [Streptomyces sp. NPDC004111]|uniref:hypothetical protein n=1 Tax=Streptomyces sp. NPDC004111 TaxID=3364690 RepID=UPI003699BF2E